MKNSKLFIGAGALALVVMSAFAGKPAKKFNPPGALYTVGGSQIATAITTTHLTTVSGATQAFKISLNGGAAADVYDAPTGGARNKVFYK